MQTLLVAGHHGSRYSSSEEFLDALRPGAIVFSCGYDNQFGFPAPEAIRAVRGAKYTDVQDRFAGGGARRIGRAEMDDNRSSGPGKPGELIFPETRTGASKPSKLA